MAGYFSYMISVAVACSNVPYHALTFGCACAGLISASKFFGNRIVQSKAYASEVGTALDTQASAVDKQISENQAAYAKQQSENTIVIRENKSKGALHMQEAELKGQQIEFETNARKEVKSAQLEHEKKIISAQKTHTLDEQAHKTGHTLKEQETQHRSNLFKNLKAHLDAMNEKTAELSENVSSAEKSAQTYFATAEEAEKSITQLNTAMDKVNEIELRLQAAFEEYQKQEVAHDLDMSQVNALHEIVLESLVAQKELETQIKIVDKQRSFGLEKEFTSDMAKKNADLKEKLGELSAENRNTLYSCFNKDIENLQAECEALRSEYQLNGFSTTEIFKKVDQLNARIEELTDLRNSTFKDPNLTENDRPKLER